MLPLTTMSVVELIQTVDCVTKFAPAMLLTYTLELSLVKVLKSPLYKPNAKPVLYGM